MLSVQNIHKTFLPRTVNERVALNDVSLELGDDDFVTVIGSNGAGKSTLLNTIAGKIRPDHGSINLAGRDVTKLKDFKRAAFIGRVFQDPMAGTSPELTIEQNMSIAQMRGKRRGLGMAVTNDKREEFAEALTVLELGLEKRMKTKVGLLSGGQRQALSLLMATYSNPKVLLLDEHTAALDPQRAELVTRLTEKVVAEKHLATLMVTHNMSQALDVGNRLIMMHEGEIILQLDAEQKSKATVEDLLEEFSKIKGADLGDKALLA